MKKILLTTAIAITLSTSFSQKINGGFKYSLGLDAAKPFGNFHTVAGLGLGISGEAEYQVSKHFSLVGNIGFISYKGRESSIYVDGVLFSSRLVSVTQVPVLVGAKYYFTNNIYASGQAGVSFFNHNGVNYNNLKANDGSVIPYASANGLALTSALSIGTKLNNHFDAAINYFLSAKKEVSLSSLGLRIDYIF